MSNLYDEPDPTLGTQMYGLRKSNLQGEKKKISLLTCQEFTTDITMSKNNHVQ